MDTSKCTHIWDKYSSYAFSDTESFADCVDHTYVSNVSGTTDATDEVTGLDKIEGLKIEKEIVMNAAVRCFERYPSIRDVVEEGMKIFNDPKNEDLFRVRRFKRSAAGMNQVLSRENDINANLGITADAVSGKIRAPIALLRSVCFLEMRFAKYFSSTEVLQAAMNGEHGSLIPKEKRLMSQLDDLFSAAEQAKRKPGTIDDVHFSQRIGNCLALVLVSINEYHVGPSLPDVINTISSLSLYLRQIVIELQRYRTANPIVIEALKRIFELGLRLRFNIASFYRSGIESVPERSRLNIISIFSHAFKNVQRFVICPGLASLMTIYQGRSARANGLLPGEAEFASYDLLFKVCDFGYSLPKLLADCPNQCLTNDYMSFALHAIVSIRSENYWKFFALLKDCSYTQFLLLSPYISHMRLTALEKKCKSEFKKDGLKSFMISELLNSLLLDNKLELDRFLTDISGEYARLDPPFHFKDDYIHFKIEGFDSFIDSGRQRLTSDMKTYAPYIHKEEFSTRLNSSSDGDASNSFSDYLCFLTKPNL